MQGWPSSCSLAVHDVSGLTVWFPPSPDLFIHPHLNPVLCCRWEGIVGNIRPHVKQEVWPALRAGLATFKRRIASIQVGGGAGE